MNLPVLPPCEQSLKIHYRANKYSRANHVSRMSRYASSPKLGHLSSTMHGWNEYLSLKRVEEAYPDKIADDEEIPEFEINDIDENEKCLFSNTQEFYIMFLVTWFE